MTSNETSEVVYCELCQLPHRRGVAACEECGHLLGTVPNFGALRAELPVLRLHVALGAAAVAALLALNLWAFGGAGYIVLLAPITWTVFKAYRYRILSTRLAKQPAR